MMPQRWKVGETGRKVNCYDCYGNWYWRLLEKLNTELLYDPTTPFLGIYPEKNLIQKVTSKKKRYKHPNVHCSTI